MSSVSISSAFSKIFTMMSLIWEVITKFINILRVVFKHLVAHWFYLNFRTDGKRAIFNHWWEFYLHPMAMLKSTNKILMWYFFPVISTWVVSNFSTHVVSELPLRTIDRYVDDQLSAFSQIIESYLVRCTIVVFEVNLIAPCKCSSFYLSSITINFLHICWQSIIGSNIDTILI